MSSYTITSPEPGFSGTVAGVAFRNGQATVDSDHARAGAGAALAYFRRKGYGVDGDAREPEEQPEPVDPRGVSTVQGVPLRDGAVDPRPTDAGLPTNAGVANPHGPAVVSPGRPTPPPAADAEAAGDTEGRPPRSASKAEWQDYARSRAADSDEEAAIDGMTKEQLVDRYGGRGA